MPFSHSKNEVKIFNFQNLFFTHPKVVNTQNKCLIHHFGGDHPPGLLVWKSGLRFYLDSRSPIFWHPKMGLLLWNLLWALLAYSSTCQENKKKLFVNGTLYWRSHKSCYKLCYFGRTNSKKGGLGPKITPLWSLTSIVWAIWEGLQSPRIGLRGRKVALPFLGNVHK